MTRTRIAPVPAVLATVLAAVLALGGCGTEGQTDGGLPAEPSAFDCPTGLEPWGADDAPPIEDLAEQERASAALVRSTVSDGPFTVQHAEPSALGVVALVAGDLRLARRVLPKQVDVPVLVGRWSPPRPGRGYGPADQAREVVASRLSPVATRIGRDVRGLDGDVGRVIWAEAGAVVVQWREPVPAEVSALAGVRDDGVRVVVDATTYSRDELARASEAVSDHLADGPALVEATGCADGSGLVVGIEGRAPDRDALVAELGDVAQMPVLLEEDVAPVLVEDVPGAGSGAG